MITNKQKRQLKALAHHLSPVVHIGKEGLSLNLIQNIQNALDAHELIKIQVLKSCVTPLTELTLDISHLTNSDLVQSIGKTLILYKPSKDKKIRL
jgi:RNA-binding protein